MELSADKRRIDWVDALRALAMFFVVYGHRVPEWSGYFVFTSPIKIPLFFAITGYVFSGANGDVITFFKKLIRTIIIPWLVLSILPYLAMTPIKGPAFLWIHVKAILVGDEFWYMPCCIAAEIIWFFTLKFVKRRWLTALISAALFAAGIVLYRFDILSVFMINRAMTVQVFLLIGWLFRSFEKPIVERGGKAWLLLIGFLVYIGLGILSLLVFPGQVMDVHLNKYYDYLICHAMIWIGIFGLFIACAKYLKKFPGWWVCVGQHTLVIYLFHALVVRLCMKAFGLVHIPINRLTNTLLTALTCAICLGISLLIHWLIPELMGKKRKKRAPGRSGV